MNTKIWKILIPVGVCLAAGFLAFTFTREMKMVKSRALPKLQQVQDFTFTDENSNPFGLQQLKGKVWIANFFFTTCSNICPVMTRHMSDLARTFDQLPEVNFVSITVNPENDTPEVLKSYADKYKHMKERWYFLSSSREDITKLVVESFKMGSIEEPIFHSPHFALVDREGFVRGYYDGTDKEAMKKLFVDINLILKSK